MQEHEFGKGGIPSPHDERDYHFNAIAMASAPFDWNTGYDIEAVIGKMPVKNQQMTFACGGYAWASESYSLDQTNREEKSEKFIYAQTHAPGGGSEGRVNCELLRTKGVCKKILCPEPNPLTEAAITTNDITQPAFADALTNKEKSYLNVAIDIESVAQNIRDNGGVVIGITGKNNGTWLSAYPQKPDNTSDIWRHWVYAGKAKMINGKKYIGFLNSWGEGVGEHGWQWISEDYFVGTFNIFEIRSMVYDQQLAQKFVFTKTLRRNDRGLDVKMLQIKLGITPDGIFGQNTYAAVKDFQFAHHLIFDGVVGPETNKVLNSI